MKLPGQASALIAVLLVAGAVSDGLTLCSGFQCGPGVPTGGAQHRVYLPLVMRSGAP